MCWQKFNSLLWSVELVAKERNGSKVSLRLVLIVPFVIEIILIAGLVSLISYRNGQRSVNEVARQLRSEAAENILVHLKAFLETPHHANAVNASLFRQGLLDAGDAEAIERHLLEQVQIVEGITSIYFANDTGGLVDAGREGSGGDLYVILTENFTSGEFRKYAVDEAGDHTKLLATVPEFDARTRPWYTGAVEEQGAVWSDAYILFTGQDMAVSASQPAYAEDGTFLGVLASDIFLSHVSNYLRDMEISENGMAFILERSGMLIASSTDTDLFIEESDGGPPRRILAQDSSDPLIRDTARSILEEFGSFSALGQDEQYDFETNRETYFVQISAVQDDHGIDWLSVVVIPESDFMGPIYAGNRLTLGLVVISVFIAVVLGILTARYVTDPVLKLNSTTGAIAEGRLDVTTGSPWIKEIDQLASSYDHMVERLRSTLQDLHLEIDERNHAELALRKRVRYEEGLSACSIDLLEDNPDSLRRALKSLQEALEVTRISLYGGMHQGQELDENQVVTSEGSNEPLMESLKGHTLSAEFREELSSQLAAGQILGGRVEEFPAEIRNVLEEGNVLSFLAVPVQWGGRMYGFLTLDDCSEARDWKDEDVRLVKTAAGIIGSYLDHLEAEQELKNKSSEQTTLLDTMDAQVWYLMDPQTYGIANRAHAEFYGLDQDQMQYRRIEEFLSPETAEDYSHGNEEVFRTRQTVQYERWVHNAEGEERLLAITKTPGIDENGEVRYVVCVGTDETDRFSMEQQLRQQDRLAAVGQLAAGIAHDFNNIITSIVLYTQMSLQDPGLPDKLRERLRVISSQADRAADLVQQILDFGRRTVLSYEHINLADVLPEISDLLKRTLPETIRLDLIMDPDQQYMVRVDPTRFQQVILNLALNARDAMPEGGTLVMKLSRLKDLPVECESCGLIEEGDWVVVEVKDSGSGIPRDVLPSIFEPFFTTKAPKGHGLGLAQVFGIVKQHEGHLRVSSELGEGTSVVLYWPFEEMPRETAAELPGEAVHGNGELVLVVEDNEPMRRALVDVLELLGYRVREAANGNEALEVCGKEGDQIALILSDWVMPGLGGKGFAEALYERIPDVRLILLTGHPLDYDVRSSLPPNVDGFMMKPPALEALAREIARALGRNS